MSIELPTAKELMDKVERNEPLTALENFIFTYYPVLGSDKEKQKWKELLQKMIE